MSTEDIIDEISDKQYVSFVYQIATAQGEILEQIDVPVSYVHGTPTGLHDKVELALLGCRPGDQVRVDVSPEEGFGPTDEGLIYVDNLANVPDQYRHIGAEVQFKSDRDEVKMFRVTHIENGKLTLDGNHPLAGKHLSFLVTVREVRAATPEELAEALRGPEHQPPA